MVVDKRNLTLEQVIEAAYKVPQSDYASDFTRELRENGVVVRNRGPRGRRGKVMLNLFVMAKRQKDGKFAYKEVIDREWPRPTSRWMTSFRKTRPARCACQK